MIGRQDILDRAGEWSLRPDVVEKDYVLGWLLSALAMHEETSQNWVFKGGTCLKKCYYETYRFSEDLDFSLSKEAVYTREGLEEVLNEVTTACARASGIEFSPEHVRVKERRDRRGRPTLEGRVGYRGPLSIPSWPRIRFDLTNHELIARPPVSRQIIHPYPDQLPPDALIRSYSFIELIAEKTRALVERVRPRDLYDVVFLLDNAVDLPDQEELRQLFAEKCRSKAIDPPTAGAVFNLVNSSDELAADWEAMLGHQLPQLPPLEVVAARVSALLVWLDGLALEPRGGLAPAPAASGELVVSAGIEFTGAGGALQVLRFAGANRLVVEFFYSGKRRRVEPYSLRRPTTGNLLLYAVDQEAGHIKAFQVADMSSVTATRVSFTPRYAVELSAHGPLTIPPPVAPRSRPRRPQTRRASAKRKCVVECSTCGKRLYRSRRSTTIREHKTNDGWPCPGRRGLIVEVR
jgi:predicted nucleotidyltransferase component of viral defense system